MLTVEFTVAGLPCLGLNGGQAFKQNEAFAFQIATEDQAARLLPNGPPGPKWAWASQGALRFPGGGTATGALGRVGIRALPYFLVRSLRDGFAKSWQCRKVCG